MTSVPMAGASAGSTGPGSDPVPAVERNVVKDMVRRSVPIVVPIVAACGAIWGVKGALSSAFSVGLVLLNLAFSAALLGWGARVAPHLLMGIVLFGYLGRLGLLTAAVLLVHNMSWVKIIPLGLSIIITHLGLLFWEMRYISASLAFPDVKPKKGR